MKRIMLKAGFSAAITLACCSTVYAGLPEAINAARSVGCIDTLAIRDWLGAVTETASSNAVVCTQRSLDLVWAERDLNGYAAVRGFYSTNTLSEIGTRYAALISTAPDAEVARDLQNERLAVQNRKQIVGAAGGDHSGAASVTNIVTVTWPTRWRWMDYDLTGPPNGNQIEEAQR